VWKGTLGEVLASFSFVLAAVSIATSPTQNGLYSAGQFAIEVSQLL
jgi:hypothetical protein